MPPHHGYADKWFWEELPVSARKAASILGYDENSWDAAEPVAYHGKPFQDLTDDEKRAATYLGRNPLEFKLKNVQWNTITEEMKKYASALGWTEETWNRNFPIRDLDVDKLYWKELSQEQKEAASYFGYNQNLWDETNEKELFDGASVAATPVSKPDKPSSTKPSSKPSTSSDPSSKPSSGEEKKDDEDKDGDKKKINRPKFSQTPAYGAGGGDNFDDGNNMHIDEITIAADANMVHGIATKYRGKECKNGSIGRDNTKTFKLGPGEFITSAKVSLNSKGVVTSLTLFTNKGAKLGPCGDDKGAQKMVKAPEGTVLCGFHGTAKRHINSIGFKWGPNSKA
ncbi:Jacalin-like lectin domain containing protein [Nitzschia inconspicua]|uniref:Jacalin-like lectin domain containing protein n=1 Tax=Nitzschia inconspicua TaxID=303405 RepID=A0A9K3K7V7_9STRA|nr:Jacalin-like lectin domain containing protein [Nitzschia inconspicua]KAG7344481.1 Jacalin-like lectin domain containing protein [Nitzschia inconspicua]